MSFDEYPAIEIEAPSDEVIDVLRRIIDLRAEDVVLLNQLVRFNSYESGFARQTASKNADYSAGVDDLALDIDSSSGVVTVTLIASPTDGQTHIISKADSSSNNVTISGNGKNINGAASISFNTQYTGRMLIYMGGAGEWRALTM